jgi:hypothetical protein
VGIWIFAVNGRDSLRSRRAKGLKGFKQERPFSSIILSPFFSCLIFGKMILPNAAILYAAKTLWHGMAIPKGNCHMPKPSQHRVAKLILPNLRNRLIF